MIAAGFPEHAYAAQRHPSRCPAPSQTRITEDWPWSTAGIFLLGSLGTVLAARASAASPAQETADIDRLGKFELVLGQPGLVVGVPHGTPDIGTVEVGQVLRERLGAGGVIVTGFWDAKTRQRVNVNRPTEQLIGPESQVLRQWQSDRARAANARYIALVKEAAQGPLKVFYEIHSNHKPLLTNSIEVSTLGVSRSEAARLKAAFEAARQHLASDVPQLDHPRVPAGQGDVSQLSQRVVDLGPVRARMRDRESGSRPWESGVAARGRRVSGRRDQGGAMGLAQVQMGACPASLKAPSWRELTVAQQGP